MVNIHTCVGSSPGKLSNSSDVYRCLVKSFHVGD